MKALRFYITLFVLAVMTGFGVDRAFAYAAEASLGDAAALDRQCSYDAGSTPRCQYCDGSCKGTGYVCCSVTVGPGQS